MRIPLGIVEANGPAAVSLLADYYPVQRRARMYGRYQIGAAIGGGLGLGVGGALVDTIGWRAAFWMWIPLGVAVTVLMARQPEPDRGEQDRDFSEDVRGVGDGLTFEGEKVAPIVLPTPAGPPRSTTRPPIFEPCSASSSACGRCGSG